ncbi:hypothetical protein JL722_1098 [Aureococcus anophagefferens]|nr:hypothetical protein JL722_1098 [Aureococcus anophagefferens]
MTGSARRRARARVSNDYERSTGRSIGNGLYKHKHLAHVAKETRLELASGEPASWTIATAGGETLYESARPEPRVDFAFPDVHTYTVRVSGAKVQSASFDVSSRVVRQELRQLSDADRDAYLSAMHTVYATSQDEGESLYGSSFKSADWLIREHIYGAAAVECDHWHDDAGILNHHVGITWQMENSMRLVDSSVAMHYWDYTYDASVYGADWQSSPVFYDSWFGTASPANEHHVVDGGRWAYTQVLSGSKALAFSNLTNPYGLLRSPWNTNKTPYLTRSNFTNGAAYDSYTTFPMCSSFASWLTSSDWVGDMVFALNGALHGPVHIMIGGQWDFKEPKWGDLTAQLSFPDAFLLLSKFLWRQGYVRCPATCSWDTEPADCECSCPSTLTGVGVTRSASEFLEFAGVDALNPNSNLELLMDEYGLNDTQYLDALCHVGHPGEMFTSAAPQDPTFWPLHGNAERYLQYARLLKAEGVLSFSESWGYSHAQELPSDTGIVCDWSGVDPASMELPTCAKETCPGHKGDDLLPFADLMDSQDGLYTNNEFYELVDPTNDDLPYVYDSLSYWPGCTDDTLL